MTKMTPDEFAKAVADLAAENRFLLTDLAFNSDERLVGGSHSYLGLQIDTMAEPFGVALRPTKSA
tara:strand:- start:8946 stop:9140 length:195 start_codon:yes stop_codon:yes gene_type:complete